MKTTNFASSRSTATGRASRLLAFLFALAAFLPWQLPAQNLQLADDILSAGSVGGTKGYRMRRLGAVSPTFGVNSNFVYYPASSIKVLQHFYAMNLVQANTWDLATTTVRTCMNTDTCGNYAFNNPNCTTSLSANNLLMMVNSDNDATNALQERIGKHYFPNTTSPAAWGRLYMNFWTGNTLGTSSTAINKKFGCGGPCSSNPNTLTLSDNEIIYQKIAGNTILNEANRIAMKDLMLNESNAGWLMAIIDEEAAALNLNGIKADFKSKVRMIYKNGSYNCSGDTYLTQGGLLQFPTYHGAFKRLFSYGMFIDKTVGAAYQSGAIQDARDEMIRIAVRGALLTWGNGYQGGFTLNGPIVGLGNIIPSYVRTSSAMKLRSALNYLENAQSLLNGSIPDYYNGTVDIREAVNAILDVYHSTQDPALETLLYDIGEATHSIILDLRAYVASTGDGSDFMVLNSNIDSQAMMGGGKDIVNDSFPPTKMDHYVTAAYLGNPRINWSLSEPLAQDPSTGFTLGGLPQKTMATTTPAFRLEAWPNPTTDFLNVRIDAEGEATIELTDMQGRTVARHRIAGGEEREVRIDLQAQPAGAMVLRVTTGDQQLSRIVSLNH